MVSGRFIGRTLDAGGAAGAVDSGADGAKLDGDATPAAASGAGNQGNLAMQWVCVVRCHA